MDDVKPFRTACKYQGRVRTPADGDQEAARRCMTQLRQKATIHRSWSCEAEQLDRVLLATRPFPGRRIHCGALLVLFKLKVIAVCISLLVFAAKLFVEGRFLVLETGELTDKSSSLKNVGRLYLTFCKTYAQ